MRIVSVVGTRPQLIKAAALSPVLRTRHHEIFVDTGQHYDDALAGTFFRELSLPRPDHALATGGGSHAEQTAAMLRALEPIIIDERPDCVLVYGDTNSTLAGALVGAKLAVPVAHVEAGLRSGDRRMPEEINRVVTDHLATWSFAPTSEAVDHLASEGIRSGVHLVGDLMQDLAARIGPDVRSPDILDDIPSVEGAAAQGRYLFATIHRAENRSPEAVGAWVGLLRAVARPDRPVILALHPGTRTAFEATRLDLGPDVRVVEPQSYRRSMALQLHAAAVLTDSGGIQRESAWLGVPCLVLRETTEWPDLIAASDGRMTLVGLDPARAARELSRIASIEVAPYETAERARRLSIPAAGAAEMITEILASGVSR